MVGSQATAQLVRTALRAVPGAQRAQRAATQHVPSPLWKSVVALAPPAADACKLRLTVLEETESGEHKVKLLGLIVSEAIGTMTHTLQASTGKGCPCTVACTN